LTSLIFPELENGKELQILKSQCIKFVLIFRNYVPLDWLPQLASKLGNLLGNENSVVRIYAACTLEKILGM